MWLAWLGSASALVSCSPRERLREPEPARDAMAEPRSLPADPGETPIGSKWWPSKWGPQDQRGAANHMTAAKALEAAKLIRTGKVYQLGRVYERDMPMPANRTYTLLIPGNPTTTRAVGENSRVGYDDFLIAEVGQMGTQMDGLGHAGVRLADGDYYYNGFRAGDFATPYGLTKLGVENVGVFFARGVLIDIAGFRGVERLEAGTVITAQDIEGALAAQGGPAIRPGDVVLLRTGHSKLWKVDNEKYTAGEPGIGLAAARWLIDRDIGLLGADNWGIEVHPPERPNREIEVHQHMITRQGICFLENLTLEELAADRVFEFAFIFAPLKVRGATGSPGNPIAVR
jgi:kynurenine formamidase